MGDIRSSNILLNHMNHLITKYSESETYAYQLSQILRSLANKNSLNALFDAFNEFSKKPLVN